MLRIGLAVAAAVVVVDQLAKWWAIATLAADPALVEAASAFNPVMCAPDAAFSGRVVEVASVFNLVMVWNCGISFGMLGGAALPPWLLAGFAALVTAGLTVWLARARALAPAVGIGLVIGGAIGNIIDRLRFGAVADFLDFHLGAYHWPAFNAADAAISAGVAVLIIDSLLNRGERNSN